MVFYFCVPVTVRTLPVLTPTPPPPADHNSGPLHHRHRQRTRLSLSQPMSSASSQQSIVCVSPQLPVLTRSKTEDDVLLKVEESPSPVDSCLGRILVVDDNRINVRVLTKQLRTLFPDANKVRIDSACNGAEAVYLFQQALPSSSSGSPLAPPFSLILMDCQMPVLDGPGACRQIRALERVHGDGGITAPVPVVACTANALPEQAQEALEAGMVSQLNKPFTLSDVAAEIAKFTDLFEKVQDSSGRDSVCGTGS